MKTKTCEWIIVIILLIAIALVSSFAILVGTSGGFDSCISEEDTTTTSVEKTEMIDQEPVSVERQIYDILVEAGISNAGACGIIANAQAESDLIPVNMEDFYNKKFGVTDEEYTELANLDQVDFVNDGVGYGLWQFTYYEFKEVLLEIAKNTGTSVGSVSVQVMALIRVLENPEFSALLRFLKNTEDPNLAATEFMLCFERPKYIGDDEISKRCEFAQTYFQKFN